MKTSSLTAEIDRLLATLHRLRQSDEAGESYVRVFQELCDLAFPQETSKAVKQEKLRLLQSARNNLMYRESDYLRLKNGRKNPEPKSKRKQAPGSSHSAGLRMASGKFRDAQASLERAQEEAKAALFPFLPSPHVYSKLLAHEVYKKVHCQANSRPGTASLI